MATVYGGERLPVHLYLPKNVKPPYQPVLFFPGALAIGAANSADLQLNVFGIDFIMMSGRGRIASRVHLRTERPARHVKLAPADASLHHLGAAARERRQTDRRLSRNAPGPRCCRMAYFGLSWGAQLGPITIALDPRLKAGVLLMGGLKSGNSAPEVGAFFLAPCERLVSWRTGIRTSSFPFRPYRGPRSRSWGPRSADKEHVLYPGGHEIFVTQHSQIVHEVIGWLDRYVGRVQ